MRRKTKTLWAIVFSSGHINHGWMRFTRRNAADETAATQHHSAGAFA
jgi:hypothetical protein